MNQRKQPRLAIVHPLRRECLCWACVTMRKRAGASRTALAIMELASCEVVSRGDGPGLHFAVLRRLRRALPALGAEQRERELLAALTHLEREAV